MEYTRKKTETTLFATSSKNSHFFAARITRWRWSTLGRIHLVEYTRIYAIEGLYGELYGELHGGLHDGLQDGLHTVHTHGGLHTMSYTVDYTRWATRWKTQ